MAQFGVSLTQIEEAVCDFSSNAGGFIDLNGREYLIRHVGWTWRIEDLLGLAVAWADGRPIMLTEGAAVRFAPALKRGDSGYQSALSRADDGARRGVRAYVAATRR